MAGHATTSNAACVCQARQQRLQTTGIGSKMRLALLRSLALAALLPALQGCVAAAVVGAGVAVASTAVGAGVAVGKGAAHVVSAPFRGDDEDEKKKD